MLVDDGSRDGTAQILPRWPPTDERVKLITLSRNFGHQAAISAGLEHARGDVVVMIDADLQDPPELIPEHDRRAGAAGADVVYAVRASRAGRDALQARHRALVLPPVRAARRGSTWPPTRATSA